MPKHKKPEHRSHHELEHIFKLIGALLIVTILAYPLLFYVTQGIAYLPSLQYMLTSAAAAAILVYCYFLVLTIKSPGKYLVVLVLYLTAIFVGVILLYLFTPLANFIIAKTANQFLCARISAFSNTLSSGQIQTLQNLCKNVNFKIFFGY